MDARLDVRIGGRIETAAPTHSVPAKDRVAILALLVLAIAVHGWLFSRTTVNARDGLSFTRLALQLEKPSRIKSPTLESPMFVDVLRKAEQAPGYPLAMLAVSKVVRAVNPITAEPGNHYDAELGERMLLSGQIANCLAGILLVVPMYLLGRMFGGKFVGFAGAAFFQVLPVAAHVTSDTLSEGCYLLGLSSALWFGCRGLRRSGIGNFLVAGGVAGMTYLVRPEGLLVVLVIGAVTAWQGLSKSWPWSRVAACLAALTVGVSLVAVPYMMMIGRITNKPSGKEMLKINGEPPAPLGKFQQGRAKPAPIVFARWYNPSDPNSATTIGMVTFAVSAVAMETLKSAHYAPVLFAAFAVFALRRRFRTDPALVLLCTFMAFNAGLLIVFAARIGYVSERHTLPLAMVICPLAAVGLVPFILVASRYLPNGSLLQPRRDRWILALAVIVSALPSATKPLHETRTGFKHAGKYLADVYREGDIIVDPFSWTEFYSGPAVTKLIPEPESAKVLYTVLGGPADKSKHVRLPKMDMARNIAKSGKPVYHWPDDRPFEEATVVVYKTLR
jgi:hypothetical protein